MAYFVRMAVIVRMETTSSVERWRPLVQWFFCIPHLIYTGVLSVLSVAVALVIGVIVLVTGRVPRTLVRFQVMAIRERIRCFSYFFVLRRPHPPFATRAELRDPGDDPLVEVSAEAPGTASRVSLVARPLICVPHLIALIPVAIVMDLCYPIWMVLASFSGGWPPAFEQLLVRVERWVAAVASYLTYVSDGAPRFGLAAYSGHTTGGVAVSFGR